jgi:alanine-glyoxylate transaminase / serine-glyoxylate transaminase / serine-pyruvate transaminase
MVVDGAHPTELTPPQRILLAPGPTALAPTVLQALIAPLTGHKDPFYLTVMDEVAQLLRGVFQTDRRTTMSLPGTGGAGMEATVANLIQPGDTAVVCINGLFGERMAEMVRRCGGNAVAVRAPWGEPIDPEDVRRELRAQKVRVVMVTHGETSTGIIQPIEEIGRDAKEHGAFLVVDTVATLGGVPVTPEEWDCDVCFSASQKCLSAPPGLSPITVSDDVMAYIRSRAVPVSNWYFDLDFHDRYWFAEERAYHHTAPVLLNYALREAVRLAMAEGLEARFARHELHQRALIAGMNALEIDFFGNPDYRLTTVLAVRPPEGINEARVRSELLNEYGVEIAGGLGLEAGKMWRIGIMGYSATQDNMLVLLAGLEALLARQGYGSASGASVAAASAVYSEHAAAPAAAR